MGCSVSMRRGTGTSPSPTEGPTSSTTYQSPSSASRPYRSPDSFRKAFLNGGLNTDARCPLDARQLYGLTKSWKAINRNMTVTAINIFVRLFETNEELKYLFSKMKHLETISELRSSKLFEGHALKVICTIDDAIVNFDDMDYVNRLLQLTAQSHCHRVTNFDGALFWRIEEPFMLAVKEELGDRFTISIETIYRTTIRYILSRMEEGFRQGTLTLVPSSVTPTDVQTNLVRFDSQIASTSATTTTSSLQTTSSNGTRST